MSQQSNQVNYSHLQRLFVARSISIIAILVAILVAVFYLQINVHQLPVLLSICALAGFNTYVWRRLKNDSAVTNNEIFSHLLVDVAALTLVLYFSGGATNPFIILFLFPIIVSVTILPPRFSWILVAITVVCYSLLMFKYEHIAVSPSSHSNHVMSSEYDMHIIGMWIAFIFSAGLIAHFVMKMGSTIYAQEEQLMQAREKALRDQKIIALGTLAASTAHELGTPLATMKLLVSELKHELPDAPEQVNKDLELLRLQVDRCKQALSNLSVSAGAMNLSSGGASSADEFLQHINSEWLLSRPGVTLRTHWEKNGPDVSILNDRTLVQAIMNILDNAADASPDDVDWYAEWNSEYLVMEICDRGAGLAEEVQAHLDKSPFSQKEQGLGLGLFLSHAIIDRFGGSVSLYNREGGGMCSKLVLPTLSDV